MIRPPAHQLAPGGGLDFHENFLAARSAQKPADPIQRAATAQGIPGLAARRTVPTASASASRPGFDTGAAAGAEGGTDRTPAPRPQGKQDPASGGAATGCAGRAVPPTRTAPAPTERKLPLPSPADPPR